MKGTLHKTEQGWVVEYAKHSELPLHPDEDELKMVMILNVPVCEFEGKEVEFEIVIHEETSKHYAKLIPSKEQQKELITEIMDLDAKDGLYDTVNDTVNKMAEEMYGKGKVPDYEEGFIDGYKKAQETLYTEEQVRFIICKSFLLGVDRGEYSKDFEDRMIESLKQPKKD